MNRVLELRFLSYLGGMQSSDGLLIHLQIEN